MFFEYSGDFFPEFPLSFWAAGGRSTEKNGLQISNIKTRLSHLLESPVTASGSYPMKAMIFSFDFGLIGLRLCSHLSTV